MNKENIYRGMKLIYELEELNQIKEDAREFFQHEFIKRLYKDEDINALVKLTEENLKIEISKLIDRKIIEKEKEIELL